MWEHQDLNYLYIDIETLPDGDVDFESLKTKEELKELVPKSYTGKRADEWVEKTFEEQTSKLNEEHRKKALNSLEGRIFCIAVAYNNSPIEVIEYNVDEKIIMANLWNWMYNVIGSKNIHTTVFVGKNVKAFDLRFIFHRTLKYELHEMTSWLPTNRYDKRIEDIGEMFDLYSYGIYTKLDSIAKFLGIGEKEGMDGSQVYDYFLKRKFDDIHKYCKGDVELTRKIHRMLKGFDN